MLGEFDGEQRLHLDGDQRGGVLWHQSADGVKQTRVVADLHAMSALANRVDNLSGGGSRRRRPWQLACRRSCAAGDVPRLSKQHEARDRSREAPVDVPLRNIRHRSPLASKGILESESTVVRQSEILSHYSCPSPRNPDAWGITADETRQMASASISTNRSSPARALTSTTAVAGRMSPKISP